MRDKKEIDKRTHQWQPENYERATFRIGDCLCELRRGRPFCAGRLLPGVLASEAASRVTSFLAS